VAIGLGFLALLVGLAVFKDLSLKTILTQLLHGLTASMVLILISAGLTFVAGILHVINISHAVLYTAGAFLGISITWVVGDGCWGNLCIAPFWFALVGAPLGIGVVGYALERVAIRRIYARDPIYSLLLTLGLTLILTRVIELLWGHEPLAMARPDFVKGLFDFGFMYYPKNRLFVLVTGAIITVMTGLFLRKTNFGLIMRAGVYDPEIVGALGINVGRIFAMVFTFSAMLAALAGVISSVMFRIHPEQGNSLIIEAFIVLVIGGMGSFRGAVVGALMLGMAKALGALFVAGFSDILVYVVMTVVLLVRPQGLFGQAKMR